MTVKVKGLNINIKVDANTGELIVTRKQVRELGKSFNTTQKSTENFTKSLKNVAQTVVGLYAVSKAVGVIRSSIIGLVQNSSNFDTLTQRLEIVGGSAKAAENSFLWIEKFSKKYGQNINLTTDAFVKMKDYGIDPTTGALLTMANTAAGASKPLEQAVEAIADAMTGENERLKEFGIRASMMGNQVSYAWRTASGESRKVIVQNNDKIITSTLLAIFNSKYEGAAQKQAKTLTGITNTITTQWKLVQKEIMDSGIYNYVKSLALVISKRLLGAFKTTTAASKIWANKTINSINSIISAVGFLIDAFSGIKLVLEVIKMGFLEFVGFIQDTSNSINSSFNWWIEKYNKLSSSDVTLFDSVDTKEVNNLIKESTERMNKLVASITDGRKYANEFIEDVTAGFKALQNDIKETTDTSGKNIETFSLGTESVLLNQLENWKAYYKGIGDQEATWLLSSERTQAYDTALAIGRDMIKQGLFNEEYLGDFIEGYVLHIKESIAKGTKKGLEDSNNSVELFAENLGKTLNSSISNAITDALMSGNYAKAIQALGANLGASFLQSGTSGLLSSLGSSLTESAIGASLLEATEGLTAATVGLAGAALALGAGASYLGASALSNSFGGTSQGATNSGIGASAGFLLGGPGGALLGGAIGGLLQTDERKIYDVISIYGDKFVSDMNGYLSTVNGKLQGSFGVVTDKTINSVYSVVDKHTTGNAFGSDTKYREDTDFTGGRIGRELESIMHDLQGFSDGLIEIHGGIYRGTSQIQEELAKGFIASFNTGLEEITKEIVSYGGSWEKVTTTITEYKYSADTEKIYKQWEAYAKDIDATVIQAMSDSLGGLQNTSRQIELQTLSSDEDRIKLQLKWAQEALDKQEELYQVGDVTLQNFEDIKQSYFELNGMTPQIVADMTALGNSLLSMDSATNAVNEATQKATKAEQDLADKRKEQSLLEENTQYGIHLNWLDLMKEYNSQTVKASASISTLTDNTTALQDSLGNFNNIETTVQNVIDKLRGASESRYTLSMFNSSMAMSQGLQGGNSKLFADAVSRASGYSDALTNRQNFESYNDMVYAQTLAANRFEEFGIEARTQIDVLEDQLKQLESINKSSSSTSTSVNNLILTNTLLGELQTQLLLRDDAIIALSNGEFTIQLGESLNSSLTDVFDGFYDGDNGTLSLMIKEWVSSNQSVLDYNNDGLVDAIKGIDELGRKFVDLDLNGDSITDVRLVYDQSNTLIEIAENTAGQNVNLGLLAESIKNGSANGLTLEQVTALIQQYGDASGSGSVDGSSGSNRINTEYQHWAEQSARGSWSSLQTLFSNWTGTDTQLDEFVNLATSVQDSAEKYLNAGGANNYNILNESDSTMDTAAEASQYLSLARAWVKENAPEYWAAHPFKRGGYTGDIDTNAIAGIVHGQEYVINAPTVRDLGLNNNNGGVFKEILEELKAARKENKELQQQLHTIQNNIYSEQKKALVLNRNRA